VIKHRFILPTEDDFKIFAAIPCENTVLVWEKWMRPPDWEALASITMTAAAALAPAARAFSSIAASSERLLVAARSTGVRTAGVDEIAERMQSHVKWANLARERVEHDIERHKAVLSVLPPPETDRTPELFGRAVQLLIEDLSRNVDPDDTIAKLQRSYSEHIVELAQSREVRAEHKALVQEMRVAFKAMVAHLTSIQATLRLRRRVADEIQSVLISCEPLPDTPCPPGIPFAAYTVEWSGIVVDVVEGKAWLHERGPKSEDEVKHEIEKVLDKLPKEEQRRALEHVRDDLPNMPSPPPKRVLTDEEKRVVEIVTQMLTERSLNPKADTRVPVREIDPAKAHQTREAEARSAVPAVRTIKFAVTPPRYLREAAERILSSPRRAHWVIGHWRNQAHGEKRQQHRQTWIKPHIRGLGEASATVSSVVAPRPPHAPVTT
jgi:hypothetical protein